MKNAKRVRSTVMALWLLAWSGAAIADETTHKIATIVGTGTAADGSSQISSEVIEECVSMLPRVADLQPVTDAVSEYVTFINGDPDRNESLRKFSATIDLTYAVRQRRLVVVTTNSVERSEPVLQEVDGRFDKSVRFTSNPENGDQYGGQQLAREYYFSTPQKAIDDAMRRAKAWLDQKKSVMCGS